MERCLDFAPFAVARFCVPLSFAEPSLCCNVAIALSRLLAGPDASRAPLRGGISTLGER